MKTRKILFLSIGISIVLAIVLLLILPNIQAQPQSDVMEANVRVVAESENNQMEPIRQCNYTAGSQIIKESSESSQLFPTKVVASLPGINFRETSLVTGEIGPEMRVVLVENGQVVGDCGFAERMHHAVPTGTTLVGCVQIGNAARYINLHVSRDTQDVPFDLIDQPNSTCEQLLARYTN